MLSGLAQIFSLVVAPNSLLVKSTTVKDKFLDGLFFPVWYSTQSSYFQSALSLQLENHSLSLCSELVIKYQNERIFFTKYSTVYCGITEVVSLLFL